MDQPRSITTLFYAQKVNKIMYDNGYSHRIKLYKGKGKQRQQIQLVDENNSPLRVWEYPTSKATGFLHGLYVGLQLGLLNDILDI